MGLAVAHILSSTCVALLYGTATGIIFILLYKKITASAKNSKLNGASQAMSHIDIAPVNKFFLTLKRKILLRRNFLFLLSMIVLFASCNTTKHLPQGEALYEGSRIKFLGKDSAKNETKGLKEELGALLRPIPNKHVAGLNTDVMLYNLFYTEKEKGFGGWLHKKVGMPPVLASSVDIDQNKKLLENRLENRGFFKASVRADTMVKDKKMHAVYTASLGGRYRFRNVSVTPDTGVMYNLLKTINTASLLTPGSFYNLDNVKAERTRIDSKLKQRGYYYFNPDFLIADADTTVGNHLIDVNWRVKKEVPARAKDQYQINDVVIYADYNPKDSSSVKDSAYSYKGFTVIDPQKKYRPIVFSNTIVLKKGDLYNINAHNQSLSRLVSLGIYKFVRVHFEETDTADPRKLNAYYYLSAATRNSLRFEVSGLTKSNNSNGGEIKLSWGMRNIFNGGELFNISAPSPFDL